MFPPVVSIEKIWKEKFYLETVRCLCAVPFMQSEKVFFNIVSHWYQIMKIKTKIIFLARSALHFVRACSRVCNAGKSRTQKSLLWTNCVNNWNLLIENVVKQNQSLQMAKHFFSPQKCLFAIQRKTNKSVSTIRCKYCFPGPFLPFTHSCEYG